MLPLDCVQEFDPAHEEEFFAALPPRSAVFLIEPRVSAVRPDGTAAHPYLARTWELRRRLERLLRRPEAPSKRLNLRDLAARVRYRLAGSAFEQSLVLYQHARERFPRRYRDFLRLRPAALLKVNLASEYPRCYVTRRILSDRGLYFGPFATRRAAEAFSNEFLDLFKVRRCQIKIRRDPSFPGCIYSEMKMCLAPCFAGCSKTEYDVEVSRVVGFLSSSGAALTSEFEREREAASDALDFERAAALHRKLEKVAEVLRGLPEIARKVDELDAVVLQPAAEENAIAVFAVRSGIIADPFFLRFGELASQPRSVEEILREQLSGAAQSAPPPGSFIPSTPEQVRNLSRAVDAPRPDDAKARDDNQIGAGAEPGARSSDNTSHRDVLAEHLALLARWFHSKPRQGEIFFPQPDWPYRRIIRACSRLLAQ